MTPEPAAVGRGAGKVILLGEHSVVHGYPALAAAADRGVEATAVSEGGPLVEIPQWNLSVVPDAEASEDLPRALGLLYASAPKEARQSAVTVQSSIPSRAGLGSSAALSVAIVRALASLTGESIDADELEARTARAEEVFHGRASGIDAAVAARGGVLRFVKGQRPAPIELADDAVFTAIVAHVEPRAQTREMVERVALRLERARSSTERIFGAIGELVDEAGSALAHGNFQRLGQLMNENQAHLRDLGVSTPKLDDACRSALEAGAAGAKLIGAGGGGCVVALTPNCADEVQRALSSSLWVGRVNLGHR